MTNRRTRNARRHRGGDMMPTYGMDLRMHDDELFELLPSPPESPSSPLPSSPSYSEDADLQVRDIFEHPRQSPTVLSQAWDIFDLSRRRMLSSPSPSPSPSPIQTPPQLSPYSEDDERDLSVRNIFETPQGSSPIYSGGRLRRRHTRRRHHKRRRSSSRIRTRARAQVGTRRKHRRS